MSRVSPLSACPPEPALTLVGGLPAPVVDVAGGGVVGGGVVGGAVVVVGGVEVGGVVVAVALGLAEPLGTASVALGVGDGGGVCGAGAHETNARMITMAAITAPMIRREGPDGDGDGDGPGWEGGPPYPPPPPEP